MGYRSDRWGSGPTIFTAPTTLRPGIIHQYSATAGAIAQTLPAASSVIPAAGFWVIKLGGAGALTVAPAGGDTINGSASAVTVQDGASLLFVRDSSSTNWISLAHGNVVSGGTLGDAYNSGGAGAGRTITADSGPVVIDGIGNSALSLSSDGTVALEIGTGGISAAPNTDTTFLFGRARIDSRGSDNAYFSHFDHTGTGVFAVRQAATGATGISSGPNQPVTLFAGGAQILNLTNPNPATGTAITWSPLAASNASAVPTPWVFTGPAHTVAALAETIDVNWNLARTVTFTAGGANPGTIALQRAFTIGIPTYARTTNPLTLTVASTLYVSAAPVAGTNVTIGDASAIEVGNGKIKVNGDGIGTDRTIGARLINNTAAANNAQQYSPVFSQKGQGWKTAATAASQGVEAGWQVRPVQGVNNPTLFYDLVFGINDAALAQLLTFSNIANSLIAAPSALSFGTGSTARITVNNAQLFPNTGGATDLGGSSNRWLTLFTNRVNATVGALGVATPAAIETLTQPSHGTGLPIAEVLCVDWAFNSTVTFGAGGASSLALQRNAAISATTYARTTDPLTIDNAATFYIDSAPVAGTNVTITNSWAFYSAAGNSGFSPDTDAKIVLGRAIVGVPTSDVAHFSHFDNNSTTNYALKQNASGATTLNSASGQITSLAVNNTAVVTVENNLITALQNLKLNGGKLVTVAGIEQTTVGAPGGASALPVTPTKYIQFEDSGGATLVFAAYAAA